MKVDELQHRIAVGTVVKIKSSGKQGVVYDVGKVKAGTFVSFHILWADGSNVGSWQDLCSYEVMYDPDGHNDDR